MNIFVPADSQHGNSSLPILFYIHGGGFTQGGAQRKGSKLAKLTGSIVVSTQYRLGVLGFVSTQSPPSNFGMKDQEFAIHWVHNNAAAFGGDASRLMMFGCSAGGASVAGHLVNRRMNGLYSSAALHSPGGHQGWQSPTSVGVDDWMSKKTNLHNSKVFAARLGCHMQRDWKHSPSLLRCLQGRSTRQLVAASKHLRFAPAMAVQGEYPLGQIRRGKWNKVPVIVGGVSCESCGSAYRRLGTSHAYVTASKMRSALTQSGFNRAKGAALGYDTLSQWYAKDIQSEGRWRTTARILSDSGHACSAALHAEAFASTSHAVWRYYFDVPYRAFPGTLHAQDMGWLFEYTKSAKTAGQRQLGVDMGLWWNSLATSGNPNHGAAVRQLPYWSAYNPTTQVKAMFLKTPPAMKSSHDTLRPECSHWKQYLGW